MELQLNRITSPLGAMLLGTDAHGRVWSLDFVDPVDRLDSELPDAVAKIVGKLEAYFDGHINALEDVPVENKGSELERRVWEALRKIPAGTTTTYGELALSLGFTDPRMAKEVGTAIGANPVALIVPCHRVIGKDGSLKGYRWGVERKRALLERETRVRAFQLVPTPGG